MKFLIANQAAIQLRAGRAIEQWLGHKISPNFRSINWLRIDSEDGGDFSLTEFEVFDDGHPDFLDIYSFEPVNPDLPYGSIAIFDSPEAAIAAAVEKGANVEKFLGAGGIQDLYGEFLAGHGPSPK